MDESLTSVEAATAALAQTAERAARLMRQETERAREEAARARREIESVKEDLGQTREEISATRDEVNEIRKEIRNTGYNGERQRKNTQIAWGTVGAMGVLVLVASIIAAVKITRTDSEVGSLSSRLSEVRTVASQRDAELTRLRSEAETARIAAAKAEGQLAALAQERSQEHLTSINEKPALEEKAAAASINPEEEFFDDGPADATPKPEPVVAPEPKVEAKQEQVAAPEVAPLITPSTPGVVDANR